MTQKTKSGKALSISVIILTCNRQHLLSRCLQSIYNQTVSAKEIILIDGSANQQLTRAVISPWRSILPLTVLTDTKHSIPFARSLGATRATGDIVVYLDDDLAANSDYLKRIRTHFLKDSKLTAVSGKIFNDRPDSVVASAQYAFYHRGLLWAYGTADTPAPLTWGRMLDCEIMGIRRKTLMQYGFPTRPTSFRHDDVELGIRLAKDGQAMLFDPNVSAKAIPRTNLFSLWQMIIRDGYWNAWIKHRYKENLRAARFPVPFFPWIIRTVLSSGYPPHKQLGFMLALCSYPLMSRIGKAWYYLKNHENSPYS